MQCWKFWHGIVLTLGNPYCWALYNNCCFSITPLYDSCLFSSLGLGIASLLIALLVRILFTFVCVLCAGFTMREKIFIALAWMPKATVQVCQCWNTCQRYTHLSESFTFCSVQDFFQSFYIELSANVFMGENTHFFLKQGVCGVPKSIK